MKDQSIYRIKGIVTHGRGIGKLIGMPTANLDGTDNISSLSGVFVSLVQWNETEYAGVTHIGIRPTIDNEDRISIETHLLSFDGDLYGQTLEIRLLKKLREPRKFSSAYLLREQFYNDCDEARHFFESIGIIVPDNLKKIIIVDELKIDMSTRIVTLANMPIDLTPKEFGVLSLLACRKNIAFSKEQIYREIWKEDSNGCYHQVENIVSQLRKKLSKKTADWEIKTVTGFGYKFECR